jgi:hypothetical protein
MSSLCFTVCLFSLPRSWFSTVLSWVETKLWLKAELVWFSKMLHVSSALLKVHTKFSFSLLILARTEKVLLWEPKSSDFEGYFFHRKLVFYRFDKPERHINGANTTGSTYTDQTIIKGKIMLCSFSSSFFYLSLKHIFEFWRIFLKQGSEPH